ncbi:MAG: ubiquinol-cytochrome c reductase iron-sulfur subunit [Candidatus Promineifilaceae bacterium]
MAEATAPADGLTRREFLYYIWVGSLALLGAEATGLLVWFMLPRFREGEFGGIFTLSLGILPEVNAPPANFPEGRFWLVNVDTTAQQGQERMWLAEDEEEPIVGVAAIYKVCTHLGCIYAWVPTNNRFECPCHGSKYRLDGRRIESPAPRTLDRFKLLALDEADNVIAEAEAGSEEFYQPLQLPPNTAQLQVDTGDSTLGPSRPLLCEFAGNCP